MRSSLVALLFQGAIVPVALLGLWWFALPVRLDGLAPLQSLILGSLGGLLTYALLLALTRLESALPEAFQSDMQRHVRDLYRFARSRSWLTLVALAVLAGLGEELLFRALIQGALAEYLSLPLAVVLASVVFGLLHCLSPVYFLVATLLGVLLGAVYVWSGSLLLVIVWHTVYDLMALFCLRQYPQWFGLGSRA